MAHYKTHSLSQPRDQNNQKTNKSEKADKMLGKGMERRFRSYTVGELEIPQQNKSSISPSSSFSDSVTTSMNTTYAQVDYITQLSNIRNEITKKIDRLIDILEERKVKLVSEIDYLITEHLEGDTAFEEERKKIESLIGQANLLGQSGELREQITKSSQRSLCRHACTSSLHRDAKLVMKDFCNELENLGRISVTDHPNYAMRSQHYSFPVRHGKGERDIGQGAGVSVANQLVYVADSENNCVQVFSLEGNFSLQMKNLPKMHSPFGICVAGEVVYVTQQQSHTLCMYSTSGELLSQAGGKGSGNDKLQKPSGLDVYESEVFVCDQENHRVQVFDAKKLSHRRKMTISSFNHPTDCHVSGSELLVLTMSDPCLHAFSLEGKLLREMITWGPGRDVTTSIFFTVDSHGNFILSELGGNCLKVFDRNGSFLSKITCGGAIHQPGGVGLDSNGQIYLVHKGYKAQQQQGMVMMC